MFNVVTRIQQQFTFSVEFNSMGWLVHFGGSLQVLISSLTQLLINCELDFMEIVHLAELSAWWTVKGLRAQS